MFMNGIHVIGKLQIILQTIVVDFELVKDQPSTGTNLAIHNNPNLCYKHRYQIQKYVANPNILRPSIGIRLKFALLEVRLLPNQMSLHYNNQIDRRYRWYHQLGTREQTNRGHLYANPVSEFNIYQISHNLRQISLFVHNRGCTTVQEL